MKRSFYSVCYALFLAAALPGLATAQSLSGTKSLITIPVADLPSDGTVTLGAGFVDAAYSHYGSYTPISGSLVFLPFLEVGFRLSRKLDADLVALGDRTVSMRVRFLTERRWRPALLVGMHDFLTSVDSENTEFNALYVVASKRLKAPLLKHPVGMHLGYGSDVMAAVNHQFVGFFGGVAVRPVSFLDLLAEYDGETINTGLRLTAFNHVQVLVALQNLDTFIGGGAVYFRLH